MNKDQREIQRKLRILRYAGEIGHVAKACRYFGIGRASFYRWRKAYAERGEAGLINAPPISKVAAVGLVLLDPKGDVLENHRCIQTDACSDIGIKAMATHV